MHTAYCAVEGINAMTIILINIDINMITVHPHLEIPGLEEPNLETNFAVQSQNHLQCSPGRIFLIVSGCQILLPGHNRVQEGSVLVVLIEGRQI